VARASSCEREEPELPIVPFCDPNVLKPNASAPWTRATSKSPVRYGTRSIEKGFDKEPAPPDALPIKVKIPVFRGSCAEPAREDRPSVDPAREMHCSFAAGRKFEWIAGTGIVFGTAHHLTSSSRAKANSFALSHISLTRAAFAIEFVGILVTAITTGIAYHYVAYAYSGSLGTYFSIGSIAALAYCMAFLVRDEYGIENLLDGCRTPGRLVLAWNVVFIALAVIGFLAKGTDAYSRGWLVLFYFAGSAAVIILNAAIVRGVNHLISLGWVRARRLMVVATESDFASLKQEIASRAHGATAVARVIVEKLMPARLALTMFSFPTRFRATPFLRAQSKRSARFPSRFT
jgi:CoA-binding protein